MARQNQETLELPVTNSFSSWTPRAYIFFSASFHKVEQVVLQRQVVVVEHQAFQVKEVGEEVGEEWELLQVKVVLVEVVVGLAHHLVVEADPEFLMNLGVHVPEIYNAMFRGL